MSSMHRTIARNMLRREMKIHSRRKINKAGHDHFGNKLKSLFSRLFKKLTGNKPGKVQQIRIARAARNS